MAQASTSATTTRSSLGPLTTTFTPPQECTIQAGFGDSNGLNGFWAAQGCSSSTVVDTITCWPPVASSISSQVSPPFEGLGFYSPGLACPSGFTTACTSALLANGAPSPLLSGTSFNFQYPLMPGETAVGCCPTGMACEGGSSSGAQTCRTIVTSGSFQIGLCGSTAYKTLYSITIPGSVTYEDISSSTYTVSAETPGLQAPLIQLVWQSSDISPITTSSASTQTSTASQSSSSTSTVSPTSALQPQDTGLSTGGKIAVGVAVPLGVIAMAFVAGFFLLRRRRQRRAPQFTTAEQQPLDGKQFGAYHDAGITPGTAVTSKPATHELGRGSATRTRAMQELPAGPRSDVTERHELMDHRPD